MSADEHIDEDGCRWEGNRESLEVWRAYKRDKALSFVRQGYSVLWSPDPTNWIIVLLPERWYANESQMSGEVKFYSKPSTFGIRGGKISKCTIIESRTDPLEAIIGNAKRSSVILFNYDRGRDVDFLDRSPRAQLLYEAILDELN
jgi:hypothetical protein